MSARKIRRNQFIKAAAVAVATSTARVRLGMTEEPAELKKRHEKPLFRFLQINDTHVFDGPPHPVNHCALANEKMKWVVETINSERLFPYPDFVIHAGDMIDGEPQNEGSKLLAPDFQVFKKLIEPLRCPFYPCMGNHENMQREGDETFEAPYRYAFGKERVQYTFEKRGLLFVVINNSGAPDSNSAPVGRSRNQWLKETLENARGKPKILCCHIPLIPIREDRVLKESFGYRSYQCLDRELLDLVNEHAETVIAVLSGHLHLTGMVRSQGIYHIVPSGTATYPCDFGALYSVYADRDSGSRCKGSLMELAVPASKADRLVGFHPWPSPAS